MDIRRILFLYTRLPDYFYQCLQTLVESNRQIEVHCIVYKSSGDAPYLHKPVQGIYILNKESKTQAEWMDYCQRLQPALVYVAGWSNDLYRSIAKKYRHQIPVVVGMDNLWKGTIKQKLATTFASSYLKRMFSHIWVPGIPQYEYARKLGFPATRIIRGLYCSNNARNNEAPNIGNSYDNKRVLFVGRLVDYKRPDWLAEAFFEIISEQPSMADWKLTFIGEGILKTALQNKFGSKPQFELISFMQPDVLAAYYEKADIFCLPSHHEHWGVVVQEAAAAGLPLLLSDSCGAASEFLLNGYNGYQFESNTYADFKRKLYLLMTKTSEVLRGMGQSSTLLSKRITQDVWVATLKSVLDDGGN